MIRDESIHLTFRYAAGKVRRAAFLASPCGMSNGFMAARAATACDLV